MLALKPPIASSSVWESGKLNEGKRLYLIRLLADCFYITGHTPVFIFGHTLRLSPCVVAWSEIVVLFSIHSQVQELGFKCLCVCRNHRDFLSLPSKVLCWNWVLQTLGIAKFTASFSSCIIFDRKESHFWLKICSVCNGTMKTICQKEKKTRVSWDKHCYLPRLDTDIVHPEIPLIHFSKPELKASSSWVSLCMKVGWSHTCMQVLKHNNLHELQ